VRYSIVLCAEENFPKCLATFRSCGVSGLLAGRAVIVVCSIQGTNASQHLALHIEAHRNFVADIPVSFVVA
jgi:hypothetical protein